MARISTQRQPNSHSNRESEAQEYSVKSTDLQFFGGVNATRDAGQFDEAVKNYFQSKGREADPKSFDVMLGDALESEKLAKQILSTPAVSARQIFTKLSVLDSELLNDLDCAASVERRHIMAFAALKVDIIRLLAQLDA